MLILLAALLVLAAAPLSAAGRAHRPASANPSARIAFGMWYEDGTDRGQIVTLRPDGRGGIRQLVPGMHNQSFCQSADGRKIAYFSDQEAPHEQFVYVANADGSQAEKITEQHFGFVCPFSEQWLLLTKYSGGWGATTLVRHDLQTGAEKTVVTDADRFSLSPDGSKLLFVGGLDYTPVRGQLRPKGKETLELIDLATLKLRRLAGPLARARGYYPPSCGCFGWSPDGRRIAYTIGPSRYADVRWAGQPQVPPRAHRYAVYVQPVAGGAARRVLRFSGGPPSISWSPDGRRLLVCAQNRASWRVDEDKGCTGGIPRPNGTYFHPSFAGKLVLVDLARGSVRRVASGKKLLFAQWAPSGQIFAYATTAAAYVARPGGPRRLLAFASGRNGHWPGGGWMGWSPDGTYVGLGSFSSHIAVVNAATGRVRVLFKDRKGAFSIVEPRWWR
jgi:dipeptidyl aminopeptidase/acylaminoacyl peptidase